MEMQISVPPPAAAPPPGPLQPGCSGCPGWGCGGRGGGCLRRGSEGGEGAEIRRRRGVAERVEEHARAHVLVHVLVLVLVRAWLPWRARAVQELAIDLSESLSLSCPCLVPVPNWSFAIYFDHFGKILIAANVHAKFCRYRIGRNEKIGTLHQLQPIFYNNIS